MTCDRVREYAPGYVLGALDTDDMIAVSDHLAACTKAHPEIDDLGGVLPYLGESLEPVEPPAWLRESVLAAARADLVARRGAGRISLEPVVAPVAAVAVHPAAMALVSGRGLESEPDIIPLARARSSRRRRILTWTTRVAAAVAVVALAGYALVLQGDLAKAQKVHEEDANINYVLTQPDTRTAVMVATDGSKASGLAALRPTGHIIVRLYDLTATTGDQVYMVWVSSNGGTPTKVGSFPVDDSGTGYLEVDNVPTSASLWIFVCREPNANVTKPTGPMIVSGTVSF
ncbi:MAG: anti-sigma factor domain-containing protein [Candidatus Limnocylindrales bacterium]